MRMKTIVEIEEEDFLYSSVRVWLVVELDTVDPLPYAPLLTINAPRGYIYHILNIIGLV